MRSFVIVVTIALAGAVGCRDAGTTDLRAPAPRTARVVLADATVRTRAVGATASGVLAARRRTSLSARVTAVVTAVLVREGDRVTAGQELFRLDDRDPRARDAAAGAELRAARAGVLEAERAVAVDARTVDSAAASARVAARTRQRLEHMYERGAISAQVRDEAAGRHDAGAAELARARQLVGVARVRLEQARHRVAAMSAEQERSQVTLSDTRVVAPFAGIIASRPADPGTLATPALPLVVLEDDDPRLECVVPATWADRLRPGDALPVYLDASRERLDGRVEEVAPAADPSSHTVLVRIGLPRGSTRRSGAFGRAELAVGTRPSVEVPATAVVTRGQLELAFVASADGVARVRLVRTGGARDDRVEILAGLGGGERVVVAPPADLQDGDRLELGP